mgnify:CR=1 FL=1
MGRWIANLANLRKVYLRQRERHPKLAEAIKEDMEKFKRRIEYALSIGEGEGMVLSYEGKSYLCGKSHRRMTCSRIQSGDQCLLSIPG